MMENVGIGEKGHDAMCVEILIVHTKIMVVWQWKQL
jgi:hypothetical protein